MKIQAISIDPAFANMGLARVIVDTETMRISWRGFLLVRTERDHHKQVRKSSSDLERAKLLHDSLRDWVGEATLAFAEVPGGNSQSAVAARGLGIAVGVLASCPVPLIEVSPKEVKMVVSGGQSKESISKAQVIAWAEKRWPDADWMRHEKSSKGRVGKAGLVGAYRTGDLVNDNEHLADAMVAVAAGIQTHEFKRLVALYNAK